MDVAPTNGADSSQIRVQIVDVYPQSLLFSGETISVVQVIKIDNVVLMAIFEAIEVSINRTNRWNSVTFLNKFIFIMLINLFIN
jgi:hypothetical protein